MGLANRRFVVFYFDLSNQGFAGDADAREFVVAKVPELGGRSVPTPPVLFMSPEGELLARVSNYAAADEVLEAMLEVLGDHPQYSEPSPEERALESPLERGRLWLDLADLERAKGELARSEEAEALYLLGHIARMQGEWELMEKHFSALAKSAAEGWSDHMAMERAHRLWALGDFSALQEALTGVGEESPRYSEAHYYLGLSRFHQGYEAGAQKHWSGMIEHCAEDPWVYRADWAWDRATVCL
ncbi:MAG: hypothetical protein V3T22_05600 [Planctomycetota bacterium]